MIRKKIEKVTDFKHLGQTPLPKDYKRRNIYQDQRNVELFWKTNKQANKQTNTQTSKQTNKQTNNNNKKNNLQDRHLPISLKKQVWTNLKNIKQVKKINNSNGPMCLANNDLWLPNMVSQ